jgi:hypothetical protein
VRPAYLESCVLQSQLRYLLRLKLGERSRRRIKEMFWGLNRHCYSIDLNDASLKIIVNTKNFGSKSLRQLCSPGGSTELN